MVLGRLGILDEAFARHFRSVAGFRNILAHEYLSVDLEVVATILVHGLDDLDRFASAVRPWLARP